MYFICISCIYPNHEVNSHGTHLYIFPGFLPDCSLDTRHILSLIVTLGRFRVEKNTILIVNTQQGKCFENPGYPRLESVVFGS